MKKKKNSMKKISKSDLELFKEKISQYKFYRESKVSLIENIYTALFVSLFIVFIEALNYLLKIVGFAEWKLFVIDSICILVAFFIFGGIYKSHLKDTFKPIFVTKNSISTIERGPITFKDKNGKEWAILEIKDILKGKRPRIR